MEKIIHPIHLINDIKGIIFWDFDGVIKDSLDAKANSFVSLFSNYSSDLHKKIKEHHLNFGGIPRREKIKLYLTWANVSYNEDLLDLYLREFANLVYGATLNSPWVPGVEKFFFKKNLSNKYFLISAIPQIEIDNLAKDLHLADKFQKIIGYPATKSDSIHQILSSEKISPDCCLFIGDSEVDIKAAIDNNVPFIIRSHEHNTNLIAKYPLLSFKNFLGYE